MMKGVFDMKKLIAIILPLLLSTSALAEEVATATDMAIADMPLLSKGLIVTAGGLCGVFLVLILFFFTIKIMQKIGK